MLNRISGTLVLLTSVAISLALPINGQSKNASPAATANDTEQPARAVIEKIVREYILQHPEVLLESVQQYQERLRTAQKERTKEALNAKLTDLQQDPSSPVAGAPGGATVVEFFDYRCGFCKKAESTMAKLIVDHPDVLFVFKEFPILGPDSLVAAKAALAAHKQGAYVKFHQALMTLPGPITMETIEQLAAKQGLDIVKLKKDMESPAVGATLERNRQLAQQVGVTATPTFVVNSELIPGAVDTPALEKLIAQAKLHGAPPIKLSTPQ
jgi:protein-disulfide isomerase